MIERRGRDRGRARPGGRGAWSAPAGRWFRVAGVLACAVACAGESPPAPSPSVAPRVEFLRSLLELARSDVLHLVLDPDRRRIELRLRGALLRVHPVIAVPRPARRIAFLRREDDLSWVTGVHEHGRLEPGRPSDRYEVEVRPGDPDSPVPEARVPLPPEEAIPAPPTWLIQFDDGLDLEVVSASVAGEDTLAPGWWEGLLQAVGHSRFHGTRLRLVLDDEDAAALYRSLSPDIRLLIAPPD